MVILFFEDQDEVYEFYSDLLADAGYAVTGAADGREALALTRQVRPDLVLLDIGLPHVDGYQVARSLRADPETAQIPIVALTGYVVDDVEERARAAGCDAVLFKPCPSDAVLNEIFVRAHTARD